MRARTGAALATGAVAAVGLMLLASDGTDTSPMPDESAANSGRHAAGRLPETDPRGLIVGCARRSEADFPDTFTSPRNLVVGPLVLVGGADTPARTVRQFGGNKFPLLVKAGHTVTVRLPRAVRPFAGLAYGGLGNGRLPEGEVRLRDAAHTMTFVACEPGRPSRRYRPEGPSASSADGWAVTFWSGFVSTDAPRCVPLEVYVDDASVPRRVGLPLGRRCPDSGRPAVTGDVPARCPTRALRALPLGPRAAERAERVVLGREDPDGLPEARAVPADRAGVRGDSARFYCGERIAKRTLVVFVHRAAFDRGPNRSASLAGGVFLVSRFADGFRIWFTLHG